MDRARPCKELQSDLRGDIPVVNMPDDPQYINSMEGEQALKKLARNNSPRSDEILAELLQNQGENELKILAKLANCCDVCRPMSVFSSIFSSF